MLWAIACYLSANDHIWFWGGAILLGLSIAFKGVGIFLVPLFASRLLALSSRVWLRSFVFALVVLFVAAVWLVPFGPSVAHMVKTRLVLGSTSDPFHASIWVIPSLYLPWGWKVLRLLAVSATVGVSAIGYWRKRTNSAELCVAILFAFTVVWLTNGAFHRMNIGILLALLVLGFQGVNAALVCLTPYLLTGVGGLLTRGARGEALEGVGTLFFTAAYLSVLCWISFSSRNEAREKSFESPAT